MGDFSVKHQKQMFVLDGTFLEIESKLIINVVIGHSQVGCELREMIQNCYIIPYCDWVIIYQGNIDLKRKSILEH